MVVDRSKLDDDGAVRAARAGYELPLLLAGAFRRQIDELHAELAAYGHPDARPLHGFALQAIGPNGCTVAALGRRLGVSKQAAAKTAGNLERLGYVDRSAHPADARAVSLQRTVRGTDLLRRSAVVFEQQHRVIAEQLGTVRLAALEADLATLAGVDGDEARIGDLPGWLRP